MSRGIPFACQCVPSYIPDMLTHDEKAQFAKAALLTFDLSPVQPVEESAAIASLMAEVDESLSLNDPATKKTRADYFAIPGAGPDDYSERLFEIPRRGAVLAGIRHLGGDPKKPFVSAQVNWTIEEPADLSRVASSLERAFKVFSASHLNIWSNSAGKVAHTFASKHRPSQQIFAARRDQLNASIKLPPTFTLELVEEEDYWGWYEEQYQAFHRHAPDLASWVPITEKKDFEEARNGGLLYRMFEETRAVGLIAGRREELLGLKGVYMLEILLSRSHTGKGLAPAMQQQFIERLDPDIEVIWGTIDSKNQPSTRTAQRVGRQAIRSEYFLPFSEL